MANVIAAIEQLLDMRLELDDTIRLLGFDPEASDRQQAGTDERVLLHLQDIYWALSREIPSVDYAKALVQEAVTFCKINLLQEQKMSSPHEKKFMII
ncbi:MULTISPECIES: hypothetical protein [Paenibacillus]|uniref:hypothetical protein n=1 Tax=Paenibacillus TaxID=44249 RepID=UPI001CE25578|nr:MULTISPECIES: hypothetical protein [Paenibacillus]MDU8674247.1 hypothetical protein [Paenibacillus polymyxa]MDU8699155.1 hypothetical protein [Paenibacillus polymyxa]URJ53827.1 hypothetical protein MF623_003139 [Paenibacillus polymyxa]URJ65674.1 hypothetical protein MF620_000485 [Paenibacillus polymyxa]URJ68336.1 hypothetical protein MF624_003122 [Paenibacillus polymyxa]